jgi:hypothetical protein
MLPLFAGVTPLANAIPDMGALSKLCVSQNFISHEQMEWLKRTCTAGGIELSM